jgi:hypothetical protein
VEDSTGLEVVEAADLVDEAVSDQDSTSRLSLRLRGRSGSLQNNEKASHPSCNCVLLGLQLSVNSTLLAFGSQWFLLFFSHILLFLCCSCDDLASRNTTFPPSIFLTSPFPHLHPQNTSPHLFSPARNHDACLCL